MFSREDAEKLKKDCIDALNKAGHRTKKRNDNSKRKQRADKKIVEETPLDKMEVKDAKRLGYSNWVEWNEKYEYENGLQEGYYDDYSEDSRA